MHCDNLATELKNQKINLTNDCSALESFIDDSRKYQNYRRSRELFDKYFTILGVLGFILSVMAFFDRFSSRGFHALVFPLTFIVFAGFIWVFMCPGILSPRAVKPDDTLVSEDSEKLWAAIQEQNRASKLLADTLEWVYAIKHPKADLFKTQLEEEALPALKRSKLELISALETWNKGFKLSPADIAYVANIMGGNFGFQNTIEASPVSEETLKATSHIELALRTKELIG